MSYKYVIFMVIKFTFSCIDMYLYIQLTVLSLFLEHFSSPHKLSKTLDTSFHRVTHF